MATEEKQNPTMTPVPPIPPRRHLPHSLNIGLILLLVLMLLTGMYALLLRSRIPATSATVRITPTSHTIVTANTLTTTIGATTSTENPLGAHRIARATASQSIKVPATGKGHQYATIAQGKLSVRVLSGSPNNSVWTGYYLTSSSGIKIVLEGFGLLLPLPGESADYSAYAEYPGASGNIPAYDVDGTYSGVQNPNLILSIQNPQPFTGGQDASDYTFVQQSDIDTATSSLNSRLTASTSAVKDMIQSQLASDEQFMNGVQCTPRVTSNHKANDRAKDVTVSMVSECAGIAYSSTKLTDLATALLSQSALAQYGTQYTLVGHAEAQIPPESVTGDTGDTVTYTLSARGIWVFQLTASVKKHFATLVTGQPHDDAKMLLSKQPGVSAVNLQTSGGLGTAMPSSQEDIQISASTIKGL